MQRRTARSSPGGNASEADPAALRARLAELEAENATLRRAPHQSEFETSPAKAAARQALLLEVTRTILEGGRDAAALAALVFEKVAPQLDADLCLTYRLDEAAGMLRLVAAPGLAPELLDALRTLPLERAFPGTATATRAPPMADAARILADGPTGLVRAMGVRAYVCHPLLGDDGRPLGTLSFGSTRRDRFDPEEIGFLQTICHFVALAWARRDTESALRESETRLRDLLATLDLGAFMARDLDGTIRFWSAGCERLYGWSAAEAVGQDAHGLLRTTFPVPREEIAAALEREGEWTGDLRQRTREGAEIVVVANKVLRRDPDGRPVAVLESLTDVTVARRAEAAQRESEARLRAALEASGTGTFRWNLRTNALECDEALDRLFGLPPGRTVRSLGKFLDLVHPDDRPGVVERCRRCAREGAEFDMEFRVVWPDGSLHWLYERGKTFRDAAGRPACMTGACADITERKRAEALQAMQNRVLELAVQDTSLGQTLDTLVRTIEAWSPSGMLGSILLLDEDGAHLRHGAAPSLPAAYSRAIDGIAIGPAAGSCGTAAHARRPVHAADIATDPLWVDFRDLALSHGLRACWSTPILSGQGRVLGTFAMYYREPRDPAPADLELVDFATRSAALVIERKRTEAAQRESEERFRVLAENVPLLCWTARADGHTDWYNQRWYDYTGATPEQMEGWGWQAVHDPDTLPEVLERWRASLASGEPFEMVFPLRGADGVFRPFLTRAVPQKDAWGRVVRWLGTNTEVRDIMESRDALAQSRAELERLVEERTAALLHAAEERRRAEEAMRQNEKLAALGQLTGGVAHDVNNLLQVIASGAALLRRPDLIAERRATVLEGMVQATRQGRELTGRLLAFARRQPLRPETFDLNARLGETCELLRQTLGARIRVVTDFAPGLWPVHADPGQLEVAVLNLAVNARDAMPAGGTLTLGTRNVILPEAEDRAAGAYVCLTVADTGEGMPPAVLARVFEPFFTTKEVGKGTGLGLPQVFGFVKQSGGDIQIESEPGKGTTVSIYLPHIAPEGGRLAAGAAAARRAVAEGAVLNALRSSGGRTVLVVDENREAGDFAAALLEELGYATRRAGSPAEALALPPPLDFLGHALAGS